MNMMAKMIVISLSLGAAQALSAEVIEQGPFLDRETKSIVSIVTPEAAPNPHPDLVWVRDYFADQIQAANPTRQFPSMPRLRRNLVASEQNYEGTRRGHIVTFYDAASDRKITGTLYWIFKDGTFRIENTVHNNVIIRGTVDVQLANIVDRQVDYLNEFKVGDTVCVIEDGKRVESGEKYEITMMFASGKIHVATGGFDKFFQNSGMKRDKRTKISNVTLECPQEK